LDDKHDDDVDDYGRARVGSGGGRAARRRSNAASKQPRRRNSTPAAGDRAAFHPPLCDCRATTDCCAVNADTTQLDHHHAGETQSPTRQS